MKKIIFLLLISFCSISSFGCEICGCGLGNYYIGIMPEFNKHFLGVRYQYHYFKTRLNDDPTQFSKDFYQTIDMLGGINFGKRWQVLAFVPYNIIHQHSDEGITNKNGLGDIAFLVNYKVLNKVAGKNSQQLWLGAGVKFATGKFDIDPSDPDVASAANTQIGSGSTDILLSATYTVHHNNLGVTTGVNYKINSENKNDYRFGNKFNANSFIYYSLANRSVAFIPNAGILFEHSEANKFQNTKVDLTGGNLLLASGGVDLNFKNITTGFNVQLPVAQNFAENQTHSKIKGMIHISFSF